MSDTHHLSAQADLALKYEQAELGHRVGVGSRVAVLVVDFQKCFVDPSIPGGSDFSVAIDQTRRLLNVARSKGVDVMFTRVAYRADLTDAGLFIKKCPSLRFAVAQTTNVEIDSRLDRRDTETILTKQFASAFYGTELHKILRINSVDTLLVCGCTTSGCVRATVVDALQNGFRALVPRGCVADLDPAPHNASLFDIDAKYGDVLSVDEAISVLQTQPAPTSVGNIA